MDRSGGSKKRLALLDESQRDAIADFLMIVAAADGVVSPAEITTLTKVFKLLGLDPASVYSRVHAATTASRSTSAATAPVTVRPETPGAPGYAIPPRSVPDEAGTKGGRRGVVQLDEAAIAAKLVESAAVSALLGSIFVDDEPTPAPIAAAAASGPSIAGLDAPHSTLLRTLAARISWPRAELEAQCETLALLPDGALDTLNEAAYEAVGDPLAFGDDPIDINPDVAQEMLA